MAVHPRQPERPHQQCVHNPGIISTAASKPSPAQLPQGLWLTDVKPELLPEATLAACAINAPWYPA
jgi:hypothetical protein